MTEIRWELKKIIKKDERIIKIKEKYLRILLRDPFLPKELLPSDWVGKEAREFVKSLQ